MKENNIVWITSYPKSGNTWIHSVIRTAGRSYGFPQADMDVYNIMRAGKEPPANPAVADKYANPDCVVLKTHSPWRRGKQLHGFPDIKLNEVAFVHVYRNPFDLLLSYINFTRLEYKNRGDDATYKNFIFLELLGFDRTYSIDEWLDISVDDIDRTNLDHALNYFSSHHFNLPTLERMATSWIANTRSWFEASQSLDGLLVRYEDCLTRPEETFSGMTPFFKFNQGDILAALDSVNSTARSMSTSGNKEQTVFYNKMRAYYFKEYYSPEAVMKALGENEAVLRDFGYYDEIKALY